MSQVDPSSDAPTHSDPKPLGQYLVDAKLLTPAHIEVALYDQRERGYRLGDILALRGWVKEEIIEWIVQNKLLPERQVQEEDFDTLLINLKEVLEQQEQKGGDAMGAGIQEETNIDDTIVLPQSKAMQKETSIDDTMVLPQSRSQSRPSVERQIVDRSSVDRSGVDRPSVDRAMVDRSDRDTLILELDE